MAGIATDPLAVSHHGGATAFARQLIVPTASRTLTKEESGAVILIETDALVMTLPKASERPGMLFTFVNGGADGACIITISPNAADGIEGEVANSASDSHPSGVNDTDFTNTKATAIKGDRCTVMSDGAGDWYVLEGVGIWTS